MPALPMIQGNAGGGNLKRVNLGSYDSRNSYTVNVENYISDTSVLARLNNTNFGMLVTGMRVASSSATGVYGAIFNGYNASTHKVSLNQSMDYMNDRSHIGYCLYSLFCWYTE